MNINYEHYKKQTAKTYSKINGSHSSERFFVSTKVVKMEQTSTPFYKTGLE